MKPRISMITLGTRNLAESVRFYEEGLGFPRMESPPEVAFFTLDGSWLALYDRHALAEDASVSHEGTGFEGFTLSHNVASEEEVENVMSQALDAGATLVKAAQKTVWGGYAGYFKDPDGHLWEIAHNPHFWVGPRAMSITQYVTALGQSLWLDNLSRDLIRDGTLTRLIAEANVSGVTSNPAIFQNALAASPYYADDLARLKASEPDAERRYEALAIPDVQAACDLLLPTHEASGGNDGYVSLEVAPRWAYNAARTVEEAQRLFSLVGRRNLLIKVPGTPEGLSAFEALTALGINVNVTLLFSVAQAEAAFAAYLRGLTARAQSGADVRRSKAVASLFLSRVDTLVDAQLSSIGTREALWLHGKAALAMAKIAYQCYLKTFRGEAFAALAQLGATPQYLLWASTGVKNPDYHDLLYVEPLIGAETINTLPDKALAALREHGQPALRVGKGVAEAEAQLAELARLGIDMDAVGNSLQDDGVRLFEAAYQKLLQQTG